MLAVRLQDEIAQSVLRRRIGNRAQQREASPLAVDRVLPGRKRDVPAVPVASLPDREPDQLQSLEVPVLEMHFCFCEFARRCALVVRCDFDSHDALLCTASKAKAIPGRAGRAREANLLTRKGLRAGPGVWRSARPVRGAKMTTTGAA